MMFPRSILQIQDTGRLNIKLEHIYNFHIVKLVTGGLQFLFPVFLTVCTATRYENLKHFLD